MSLVKVFSETYERIKNRWLNLLVAGLLIVFYVIPIKGVQWIKFTLIGLFLSIAFYDIVKKTLKEAEKELSEETLNIGYLSSELLKRIKSNLVMVAIAVFLLYKYVLPVKGMQWIQLKFVEMFLTLSVFEIIKKFFKSLEKELE